MKIIIAKDYNEMSRLGGEVIANTVKKIPDCLLGLATGTTPLGLYAELAQKCSSGELDFSKVKTVNLDEYYGISPENENSYRYFMNKNLFSKINIDLANTRVPDGQADDIDAECKEYDKTIDKLGGIDLQLLGLGHDGHIGFNEPDECFYAETHKVELTEMTIEANSRLFEKKEDVPKSAVTMGMRAIMQAREILMIVSGEDKREILKKTLYGPITPYVPASLIQLHPNVTVITDIKL